MNVVALIARRFQTDVCSAYLLEPDRANLVLAATLGLRPQVHRHAAHGARTKGWPGWWPSRCARSPSNRSQNHPRFKYFSEAGEDAYQSFLGVPLIDRGVLQGVLVVQTIEARVFREDEVADAGGGGRAGGAGGQRSAHARSLHRAGAGAAVVAGAQSVVELGPRFHQPVPRSRSGALAAAQSQSRSRCCREIPLAEAGAPRRRTGAARPHQLRLSPPAGISASRPHLGRHPCRRSAAASGGLLLGRIRTARIASRFTRAAWAFWPAITSRARPTWTFRWSASACFTARAISASASIATAGSRKNTCRPTSTSCPWSRPSARTASRSTVQIETRSGVIRAKVWRVKVGRCDLLLLDSNVEGNAPEDRELTSRLYGGDGRVRIRQELLLGVGGFRALKAMGITPGVLHLNEGHSGFAVLEAIREPHAGRRASASTRPCRASPAKWSSPPTRRCPPATTAFNAGLIEEHLGPLRERLGLSHDGLMDAGPRESRQSSTKSSA